MALPEWTLCLSGVCRSQRFRDWQLFSLQSSSIVFNQKPIQVPDMVLLSDRCLSSTIDNKTRGGIERTSSLTDRTTFAVLCGIYRTGVTITYYLIAWGGTLERTMWWIKAFIYHVCPSLLLNWQHDLERLYGTTISHTMQQTPAQCISSSPPRYKVHHLTLS